MAACAQFATSTRRFLVERIAFVVLHFGDDVQPTSSTAIAVIDSSHLLGWRCCARRLHPELVLRREESNGGEASKMKTREVIVLSANYLYFYFIIIINIIIIIIVIIINIIIIIIIIINIINIISNITFVLSLLRRYRYLYYPLLLLLLLSAFLYLYP